MIAKTALLIMSILLFAGTIPAWSYSRRWGYLPSVIFVVMMFLLVGGW